MKSGEIKVKKSIKNIIIGILTIVIIFMTGFIAYLYDYIDMLENEYKHFVKNQPEIKNENKDNVKVENETNDNNKKDIQEDNTNSSSVYEFGKKITLPNLTSVPGANSSSDPFEAGDPINWYIITADEEYVTLYSETTWYGKPNVKKWGKDEKVYKGLTDKGINFGSQGEARALNEDDLKIFGCNLDTLQCNNIPEWINTSQTGVERNGNTIYIWNLGSNKKGIEEANINALADYRPVIKILKSNIS